MFCVECGTEGPTYEGLCAKCFTKRHAVVEPPEVLDLPRCKSCGSYRFESGWSKLERDLAVSRLLKEEIPPRAPFVRVSFTHVARDEDANNFSLTVKALGRYEDLEAVRDFRVRVRVKPSLCDPCQKQRSRYYEGILQVRGDDRELTPKEMRAVRTFVVARVERPGDPQAFLSRIEEVHGGLDFYLSTNALGKAIARELCDAFGGRTSASPKLFGQQQGREVYRVTSLVRLPAFGVGDVVRYKGGLAEVLSLSPFVVLRDLATGESRRFKTKDVRSAKRVDAERFEASVERLDTGEVVAIHPETGEARPLTPPAKGTVGRATIVWTRDGAFRSGLPAEPAKG